MRRALVVLVLGGAVILVAVMARAGEVTVVQRNKPFTTKPFGQGTGQGLAIAHSVVVKKHGGSIKVQTGAGRGTTFRIRLPIDGGTGRTPPDLELVAVSEDQSAGAAIR
jgi:hypothetical protein